MKKLIIEKVYRDANRLCCDIMIEGNKSTLWIEVENEYAPYLVDDRADVFFTICVYKCIKENCCLQSLVPVSTRLKYQVENYMMNVYCETYDVEQFQIDVLSIDDVLPSAGAVGTGITCGVDSLYTIACHSNLSGMECLPDYHLTH